MIVEKRALKSFFKRENNWIALQNPRDKWSEGYIAGVKAALDHLHIDLKEAGE